MYVCRCGVLAYKVGMMSLWDSWGERHAVTVCQLDRCVVLQQKTLAKDGYEACVLGIGALIREADLHLHTQIETVMQQTRRDTHTEALESQAV